MLIDIAFTVVEYRGWRNVQLHIIDIRTRAGDSMEDITDSN